MSISKTSATILRAPKNKHNPYTSVRRATFEDRELSWEARGLLGYLLVKPDDWEIQVNDLIDASPDGRDKVYRILAELVALGYMEREEVRERGRFQGVRYLLHEEPMTEKPDTDIPLAEKPDTEKPDTEESYPENPDHTNKEVNTNNEEILNTNTTKGEPPPVVVVVEKPVEEKAMGGVFACWMENMPGTMTAILQDDLSELIDTYGPDEVIRAITIAVQANARSMRYVAGVLRKRAAGQDNTPARPISGGPKVVQAPKAAQGYLQ